MHISTNDLHCCKPARLLQQAPSGGRPCRRPTATAPPHIAPPHQPATDCVGRLVAGRQQTAPPQQHRSKDDTAHPHQPGAHPDPPHPDPAHSSRHHPAKAKVKFPLRNRIFFSLLQAKVYRNRQRLHAAQMQHLSARSGRKLTKFYDMETRMIWKGSSSDGLLIFRTLMHVRADANVGNFHLNLNRNDSILERAWVFQIDEESHVRLILHAHTFLKWSDRGKSPVKNRADALISLNCRLVVRSAR
jgi:hypothetical protein